jgi:hypothetical protein
MIESVLAYPLLDYARLYRLLVPVGALFLLAGFVGAVAHAHSPQDLFLALLRLTLVIALIANFDAVTNEVQDFLHILITQELQADPASVVDQCVASLHATWEAVHADQPSGWGLLTRYPAALFQHLIVGVVILVVWLAQILVFLAYLVQKLCLHMGYALAPLFLGFLMLPSLRAVGVHYLLSLAGVLLWPLGWAVASLVTQRLFQSMTDNALLVRPEFGTSLLFAARNLLAGLALAVWIILSTLAAPWAMQRAITGGVQIGSATLSRAVDIARRRF